MAPRRFAIVLRSGFATETDDSLKTLAPGRGNLDRTPGREGKGGTAEAGDIHTADLPRLRFRFDRRSLGRLRLLIDAINRGA